MKTKLYLAVISCLVFAGQAGAQQTVRPTRIYREYPGFYPRKEKYECEYDNYGHITSLKIYEWDGLDYVFKTSVESEYHRLPNSEFVKTKEEKVEVRLANSGDRDNPSFISDTVKQRYTSAYDSNGMQLWSQIEKFDHPTSTWNTEDRTEARMENGVRTAILNNGEVDDSYTFDSKGRVEKYRGVSFEISYTWNDNDRIVAVVDSGMEDFGDGGGYDDPYSWTYTNIEIAYNEKYYNPYSLNPLDIDGIYIDLREEETGENAIDDYTLHGVCYNLDVTSIEEDEEYQGQIRTTISDDENTITQSVIIKTDTLYRAITFLPDRYGSYRILKEEEGMIYEHSVSYNQYGELVSDSLIMGYDNNEEYLIRRFRKYDREYDNQNRPVKTIYYRSKEVPTTAAWEWEETYDQWTTVGLPSGIRETTPQSAVSIYPNPAAENINLSGISGKATVVLSDINGRVVLVRNINGEEPLPVAHLPAGLYFVNIRTNEHISTVKFIKY